MDAGARFGLAASPSVRIGDETQVRSPALEGSASGELNIAFLDEDSKPGAGTENTALLLAVEINKIFDAMAPKGTRLEATGPLFAEGDGLLASGAASGGRQRIAGMYQPLRDLIKVSLTTDDPKTTIRHETLHALKAHGLFTDQEWTLLEAESRARWMDHWGVPDVEEGIAYEFGACRRGDKPSGRLLPAVRRAFKRLNDFLTRIANMLGGMGFQTYEDVFARIESGAVRGREGRGASGREARFAFKRKGDAESAAEEMTAATGFVHLVQPADPYANRPKSWVVSNRFVPVEVSGAVLTPRQQRFRDNMDRQRRGETVDWEAEDRDFQQAAEVGERYAAAWHGSPHEFDGFTTDKIGTGEGAQAYGWGLYFASKRAIAEYYRDSLSQSNDGYDYVKNFVQGVLDDPAGFGVEGDIQADDLFTILTEFGLPFEVESKGVADGIEVTVLGNQRGNDGVFKVVGSSKIVDVKVPKNAGPGRLYQVELAPAEDEYLLWDKPLSEQSKKVQDAISLAYDRAVERENGDTDKLTGANKAWPRSDEEWDNVSGQRLYERLSSLMEPAVPSDPDGTPSGWGFVQRGDGGQKPASELLHSIGIRGIKYLDATSRNKGDGDFNYVIFDEKDISIEAKYAIARDTSAESPAGLWQRGVMETAKATGVSVDAIRKAGGPLWGDPEKARGTADQEAAIARILADRTDAPVGERIRDAILGIKERRARSRPPRGSSSPCRTARRARPSRRRGAVRRDTTT